MNLWELFVKISGDNSSYKQSMKESQDVAVQFGSTLDTLDKKMGAAIGLTALAAGSLAAANKFEDASVRIQRATGATGDKLDGLEKSFTNVYTQTGASAEKVSATLALLSTRTQATGKDLEGLTLSTLRLAKVQGEDVATIVPAVTQMFATWSIATNQQSKALDYLRVVSQQTGTPVSKLTEEVVSQAPALKDLGYNWEQAVTLIGNFDKSGAVAQGGLTALKKVMASFAKEGITDTATAWKDLVKGIESGNVSLGQFEKIAGAKGGEALFDSIRQGAADVQKTTEKYDDMVAHMAAGVSTLHERFTIYEHDLESLIAKHYELITAIGLGGPLVLTFGNSFLKLGQSALPVIANITTAISGGLYGALTTVEAGIALASTTLAGVLAVIGGDALLSRAANSGTGIGSAIAKGIRTGLLIQFPNLGGLFSNDFGGGPTDAPPSGLKASAFSANLKPPSGSATGGGLPEDF